MTGLEHKVHFQEVSSHFTDFFTNPDTIESLIHIKTPDIIQLHILYVYILP